MGKNKNEDNIELSPKYGANPTMPICFWCGKDTGEIAILGRLRNGEKNGDFEAPRHMILDYEPCANCKAKFKQGVLIAETIKANEWSDTEYGKNDPDRPAITDNEIPTGRHIVLKTEAFNRVFNQNADDGDVTCMNEDDFTTFLKQTQEAED